MRARSTFGRKLLASICCWGILAAPGGLTGRGWAAAAEMGLEEMFFVDIPPVYAVSKRAESVAKAPGVVSVLTAQDIKDLGAQTLSQAIGFMPGVQAYDSYWTQFNQFAFRGNLAGEHYNAKILFLVNGHPTYFGLTGGFEVDSIPLDAVDRVEVIRGPVSVQYGTNALTGVINVVTRKEVPSGRAEASYQYGYFATHDARVSASRKSGDTRVFFSGAVRNQDGYLVSFRADQDEPNSGTSTPFTRTVRKDYASSFLNLAVGDFEMDVTYWNEHFMPKAGLTPDNLFQIREFFNEAAGLDLRYTQELGEGATLHYLGRLDLSGYDYLRHHNSLATGPFLFTVSDRKAGAEVYGDFAPSDKLSLIAGVLYDNNFNVNWDEPRVPRSSANPPNGIILGERDRHTSNMAGYVNFDFRPWQKVSLVGGTRYTNNEITGENWSYRTGGVFDLTHNLTFKALYGTSYRTPSIFEQYLVSSTVLGNRNLKVETLKGADYSVVYALGAKGLASVTYFTNTTRDFITRVLINSTQSQYVNLKGQKSDGLEYEFRYKLFQPLTVWVNGSHLLSHRDLLTDAETQVIEEMVNFGANWQASGKLRLSAAGAYHSGWPNIVSGVTSGARPYTVMNLAASLKPEGPASKVELFANAGNVFNQSSEYAEFVRKRIATIPGGPPRSIMGGIKLSF